MVVPVFLAAHKVSLVVALAVVFHFRGKKIPREKLGIQSQLCMRAGSLQACPTLGTPIGCNPPGFPVHRILQAKILEWVAISSFRGSS